MATGGGPETKRSASAEGTRDRFGDSRWDSSRLEHFKKLAAKAPERVLGAAPRGEPYLSENV